MSLHISLDQQIAELVDRAVRQALTEVLPQAPIQREALSVAEAAEALGMSESWVRTAIRQHAQIGVGGSVACTPPSDT